MTISQTLMAAYVFTAALTSATRAQAVDMMSKQKECTSIVKANMSFTARKRPAIFKTVKAYFFEYSPSRDSCIEIVQYKVHNLGQPHQVQILAYNAVTQQPMEGYEHIFLQNADDLKGIQDATNFLFELYSH